MFTTFRHVVALPPSSEQVKGQECQVGGDGSGTGIPDQGITNEVNLSLEALGTVRRSIDYEQKKLEITFDFLAMKYAIPLVRNGHSVGSDA